MPHTLLHHLYRACPLSYRTVHTLHMHVFHIVSMCNQRFVKMYHNFRFSKFTTMIWRHVRSDSPVILETGPTVPPALPQVYLLPRILTPSSTVLFGNSSFPNNFLRYEAILQICREDAGIDKYMQVDMLRTAKIKQSCQQVSRHD